MIVKNEKNQPLYIKNDNENMSIRLDPETDMWHVKLFNNTAMPLTIKEIEDLYELCEAVFKDVSK